MINASVAVAGQVDGTGWPSSDRRQRVEWPNGSRVGGALAIARRRAAEYHQLEPAVAVEVKELLARLGNPETDSRSVCRPANRARYALSGMTMMLSGRDCACSSSRRLAR